MGTNSSQARDRRVRKGRSRKPADHVRRVIGAVIRDAREPVLFSCVRLSRHGAPVVAQANLDLTGRTVRVGAEAPTPEEAVDLLAERLWERLGPEGHVSAPGPAPTCTTPTKPKLTGVGLARLNPTDMKRT